MAPIVLEFERSLVELERKLEALRAEGGSSDRAQEIQRLEGEVERERAQVFEGLTGWQRVQIARHPARPRPLDLAGALIEDLTELHGDRVQGDDPGLFAGLGYFDRRPIAILAHARGRAVPGGRWSRPPTAAGLRKAARLVDLAGRSRRPVLCLVDLAEPDPRDADDPTRAAAVGALLAGLVDHPADTVAAVTGEAYGELGLALTATDRLLMFEHAVLAPLSPESCSVREWGEPGRADDAAELLALAAPDLLAAGACDQIVEEPPGGAHRHPDDAPALLAAALRRQFTALAERADRDRSATRQARIADLARPILEGPPERS